MTCRKVKTKLSENIRRLACAHVRARREAGAGGSLVLAHVGCGSPRNRVFTNDHHGPWSREAGVWQGIHLALYQPRDFVLQQKRPGIHAPRSISSFPIFDFFYELRYIRFLWTIN
jgi:hypothetical protein